MNYFIKIILLFVLLLSSIEAKKSVGKVSKEYLSELKNGNRKAYTVKQGFVNSNDDYILETKFLNLLPVSGGIGDIYESIYSAGVNEHVGTAGFTFNERPRISVYGHSHNWNNFTLQGISFRSVLNTQKPIFNLPLLLTDNWTIKALSDNEISTSFLPVKKANEFIQMQYYKTVFGPYWMPMRTFDREPASQWGAPSFRRNFSPSFDLVVRKKIDIFEDMPSAFHLSANQMTRNFLGQKNSAKSYNTNFIWQQQLNQNSNGVLDEVFFLVNVASNSQYGGEKFRNQTAILSEDRVATGLIYNTKNNSFSLQQNILFAKQSYNKLDNIIYYDAIDTVQQGSLNLPNDEFELQYNANFVMKKMKNMQLRLDTAFYYYQRKYSNQFIIANSFFESAKDVTLYETSQSDGTYLKLQPSVERNVKWKNFEFDILGRAKIDIWANSFSSINDQKSFIWDMQPVVELNSKWSFSSSWLKLRLAHKAIDLTSNVNDFVNPQNRNARQYQWNDSNNDSSYSSNEKGNLINKQGGNLNDYDVNLSNPVYEEADLALFQPLGDVWKYIFRVNFRMYRNLYSVNNQVSNLYNEKQYIDNGQTYTVFDRNISIASGRYSLVNNKDNALNLSFEMQLFKKVTSSGWIFNFSASVYSFLASPPVGSGPDFNDIGEFNLSQANPNFNNSNNFGRTNGDRAYTLKLIFGKVFFRDFSIVNILHYRDGEALAQVVPVYGLSQGPILIQGEERGGGLVGTPRYTYYLQWDIRLQAAFYWLGQNTKMYLDIYNLLDSQSEFREYLVRGPSFRAPSEVVMPRSIVLGIKIFL